MIVVGVNENVFPQDATLNDKGTLVFTLKEAGTAEVKKEELSAAAMLADSSDTTGDGDFSEGNFMFFMPGMEDYEKNKKSGKDILADFTDLKNQLTHILKRFLTEKEIKWAPFAGVPINMNDDNDVFAKLEVLANVEKVYANFANNFITMITPFLKNQSKLSRLLLVRRSSESHYGTLRKKFLGNQPFLEDSAIPVNQSKLYTLKVEGKTTKFHEPVNVDGQLYVPAFSDYELKKGLDNPAKSESVADTQAVNTEEIENVDSLFSGGDNPNVTTEAEANGEPEFKIEGM